jgi:hypothetical protein
LCPQLKFERKSLQDYLTKNKERVTDWARSDHPNEIEAAVTIRQEPYERFQAIMEEEGCTQLSGWRPLEMDRYDVPGSLRLTCVYPHFMLGLTPGGSVVGVFGLTVWT